MVTAIDMIGTNQDSGTKTYNLNFCEYLNTQNLKNKIIIFTTKDYLKDIKLKTNQNIQFIIKPKILKNILFRMIWMQFFLPFELKKNNVSQLFSPMNIGPIFIKYFRIKFILGLHSNLPWTYFSKMPGNYLRKIITKYFMQISIYNCDKLIVNSVYAKNEIIKFLKVRDDKIFVVYLGINQKYLNKEKNEYYLNNLDYKNYCLSVISCAKYHNILNMLKGFKSLIDNNNLNLQFILVLQILDRNYFYEIKQYVKKNFLNEKIIFLHNLNNKYLINLYKKAEFYIFSSYSEVFGLTSLEAMSQGCPILISKSSALPEINGKAAEYFNPDDINQITQSMKKILFDNKYRNEIISNGIVHSNKFRWEKTVRETIKILNC